MLFPPAMTRFSASLPPYQPPRFGNGEENNNKPPESESQRPKWQDTAEKAGDIGRLTAGFLTRKLRERVSDVRDGADFAGELMEKLGLTEKDRQALDNISEEAKTKAQQITDEAETKAKKLEAEAARIREEARNEADEVLKQGRIEMVEAAEEAVNKRQKAVKKGKRFLGGLTDTIREVVGEVDDALDNAVGKGKKSDRNPGGKDKDK